jgi:hypothetical protein
MSILISQTKPPTMAVFNRAVKACLASAGAIQKAAWNVGDNALLVETAYKSSKLYEFADAIALPYKTVMDYRRIAAAYPASDRSDVSWTVHQIFGQLANRAELVKRDGGWTTKQARSYVESLKTGDGAGGADDETDETGTEPTEPATELSLVEKLEARVARLQADLMDALGKLAMARAEEATKLAALESGESEPPKAGTAKAGTAKAGTAKAGTAKAGTAKTSTAKAGTAKAGTAKAGTAAVAQHSKDCGIPQHRADAPRTDCSECKAAGIVPMPARTTPRNARNRVGVTA